MFANLDPAFIIDVGVAKGTSFLINNFPRSYYFLVEPNPRYHSYIEHHLLSGIKGELLPFGAGSTHAMLDLREAKQASSFLMRDWNKFKNAQKIQAMVKPLDKILPTSAVNEQDADGSILLKIDTEGFEMEVLKGAELLLKNKRLQWLIIETREALENQDRLRDNSSVIAVQDWFDGCDVTPFIGPSAMRVGGYAAAA